jgi:cholesterol transport system auxiliary component
VNVNTNKYALSGVCIRPHGCCSRCTLFVAEPTAQAGFESDQMIYLECPYQPKAYSKNRWVAPPSEMLTSLIAQSLRNTCYFKAVVTAPFAGEAQYRIETRLIKLQQEFFCCPSRERMTLHAVLLENKCHQAICEKVFEVVIPAPKNNPYGGVVAANRATQIIMEQLANFVICSIQRQPSIPLSRNYDIRKTYTNLSK